jgi:glycosyltransferase involved in cell wall biosynthesis
MTIKFSVVIPLYNKEKYIVETVNSVLNQSYKNFELLIVNDGSTDGGVTLLEDIKDERIRLFNKKNEGEGPARNYGIVNAKGNWIAFLDADDVWYENHLEIHANTIKINPDAVLISNAIDYSDNMTEKKNIENIIIKEIDYFDEVVKTPGIVHSSSAAINARYINEIGYFLNNKTGVDTEYWQRVYLMKFKIYTSSACTVMYRKDTGGAMDEIYSKLKKGDMFYEKLEDINLPIASLLNYCSKNKIELIKNTKLTRYINYFIESRIKTTILFEDVKSFKKLILILLPSNKIIIKIYKIIFIMPDIILIFLFKLIKILIILKKKLSK